MRVLGLVPARGGSKGVLRKNVRPLGGKPLIVHTIEAALASGLDRVVVSTDDDEIAAVSRAAVAEVLIRPAGLAEDETPTFPVVAHAIDALDDGFDAVCLLQPTSPFRSPALIDACLERLVTSAADSVITVRAVPADHNPHWVYLENDDGLLRLATGESEPISRRQDLPAAFHRDGSVYVTRTAVIRAGSLYGDRVVGIVNPENSGNIDTLDDWDEAEDLLAFRVRS